jgi:hypothetical protein
VLVQEIEPQLVWPPVAVCRAAPGGVMEWAASCGVFVTHEVYLLLVLRWGWKVPKHTRLYAFHVVGIFIYAK